MFKLVRSLGVRTAARNSRLMAAACCVVSLLCGCTPSTPTPRPAVSTALPALSAPERVQAALAGPADLSFGGRFAAEGWRRCDEHTLESVMAGFRRRYMVEAGAAATWVHAAGCDSADLNARLDQFVWVLGNENDASDVLASLHRTSLFNGLPADARTRLKESKNGPVFLRTLPGDGTGSSTSRSQAEMMAQDGTAVLYMLVTSGPPLKGDDYFSLARASLDRLRTGRVAR